MPTTANPSEDAVCSLGDKQAVMAMTNFITHPAEHKNHDGRNRRHTKVCGLKAQLIPCYLDRLWRPHYSRYKTLTLISRYMLNKGFQKIKPIQTQINNL